MIQSLSEMDDHLGRRDSYMATAGANNGKIFSKNKYIASELCTLIIENPVSTQIQICNLSDHDC